MQIQINCPYIRNSVFVNNGQQQQVFYCADMGRPVNPEFDCAGSGCRFVNIEPKPSEMPKETQEPITDNVTDNVTDKVTDENMANV